MLEVTIPGHKTLNLSHLVLDYNGTIACDGRILEGVKERLETLAQSLEVHILTADTFGGVRDTASAVWPLPPYSHSYHPYSDSAKYTTWSPMSESPSTRHKTAGDRRTDPGMPRQWSSSPKEFVK